MQLQRKFGLVNQPNIEPPAGTAHGRLHTGTIFQCLVVLYADVKHSRPRFELYGGFKTIQQIFFFSFVKYEGLPSTAFSTDS